jgi:RHS repeat-associated protein
VELTDGSPTDGLLKYTGHERDPDLLGEAAGVTDYMHARYYPATTGRFINPDPVYGNQHIPQSWNRYTYTLNNPLRYIDPDGRTITIIGYRSDDEYWRDFWGDFFVFGSGVANAFGSNGLLGLGRQRRDDDTYQFGQLVGDGASMVLGYVEVGAGVSGEVGGLVLDVTGVGAAVGIPVQIVSGALIAHGATTTVISSTHFMSGIKQRKAGKHGTFRGRDSKRANDAPVKRVAKEKDLNADEQQRLHREIGGGDLTYEEIRDLATALFGR